MPSRAPSFERELIVESPLREARRKVERRVKAERTTQEASLKCQKSDASRREIGFSQGAKSSVKLLASSRAFSIRS